MTQKNRIILVQPTMGFSGEYVRHPPLSLLYVASGLVKAGFQVSILDNRLHPGDWERQLRTRFGADLLFVGVTVMSGAPIANALRVSKLVKEEAGVPVVWGGPHPTTLPDQVLENDQIDFCVSGSGVSSTVQLALRLAGDARAEKDFSEIPGLGYKADGRIVTNARYCGFEAVHHRDIPYHLIEDFRVYGQIGSSEIIFPIYAAFGCPHKCAFCVAPHLYQDFEKKWVVLPAEEVADHIAYLKDRYGATHIYFYDDDSFIDLKHPMDIIQAVLRRGLKVRLSFRGARVNEVLRMDDAYLAALTQAGTRILHIGIESGSPRILRLFNKGITVDQITAMNEKLARYKQIVPAYNWIIGTPSETPEEIRMTTDLILRLVRDNPGCFIFPPNKFEPFPGTRLFDMAVQYGYQPPQKLEDWILTEKEGTVDYPWYSREVSKLIRMLQVTSYFVDRKAEIVLEEQTLNAWLIKVLSRLYRPFARWRFRHGISAALAEYYIYQFAVSRLRK